MHAVVFHMHGSSPPRPALILKVSFSNGNFCSLEVSKI